MSPDPESKVENVKIFPKKSSSGDESNTHILGPRHVKPSAERKGSKRRHRSSKQFLTLQREERLGRREKKAERGREIEERGAT